MGNKPQGRPAEASSLERSALHIKCSSRLREVDFDFLRNLEQVLVLTLVAFNQLEELHRSFAKHDTKLLSRKRMRKEKRAAYLVVFARTRVLRLFPT